MPSCQRRSAPAGGGCCWAPCRELALLTYQSAKRLLEVLVALQPHGQGVPRQKVLVYQGELSVAHDQPRHEAVPRGSEVGVGLGGDRGGQARGAVGPLGQQAVQLLPSL